MRTTEIRDDFQNIKIDKAYKNIVIVFLLDFFVVRVLWKNI